MFPVTCWKNLCWQVDFLSAECKQVTISHVEMCQQCRQLKLPLNLPGNVAIVTDNRFFSLTGWFWFFFLFIYFSFIEIKNWVKKKGWKGYRKQIFFLDRRKSTLWPAWVSVKASFLFLHFRKLLIQNVVDTLCILTLKSKSCTLPLNSLWEDVSNWFTWATVLMSSWMTTLSLFPTSLKTHRTLTV